MPILRNGEHLLAQPNQRHHTHDKVDDTKWSGPEIRQKLADKSQNARDCRRTGRWRGLLERNFILLRFRGFLLGMILPIGRALRSHVLAPLQAGSDVRSSLLFRKRLWEIARIPAWLGFAARVLRTRNSSRTLQGQIDPALRAWIPECRFVPKIHPRCDESHIPLHMTVPSSFSY